MSLTIELTPEEEAILKEKAKRRLLEPADYVRSLIASDTPKPMTGAEIIAFWEANNCLGHLPDTPDSVELAQQWREEAERRDR